MKNPESGFIFLFTLGLTAVMTLLLLTLMNHLLLYYKAINKQEMQHQNFYQLEDVARQLANAKENIKRSSCAPSKNSANRTLHELVRHKGCSIVIGNAIYHYFIEELGIYPCLVINKKNHYYSTRHQRISILTMSHEEETSSVLQIRFIKPINMLRCSDKTHFVTAGVSSWRYFAEYKAIK